MIFFPCYIYPFVTFHYASGEAYVKSNQLQESRKHFKTSTELTKNELPNLALARLYLLDDMIPEARNAYIAALK